MYPGTYAETSPGKPAIIMGATGEVVTYAELNARSNQLAQLIWAAGLRPGDHLAIFMENHPRYYEVAWAALRSGLLLTTINRYLTAEEAAFIIDDCEAQVLVASKTLAEPAAELTGSIPRVHTRLMVDGAIEGYEAYEDAIARFPAEPVEHEYLGGLMLYSSGTTGQPKGISRPLTGQKITDGNVFGTLLSTLFAFTEDSVYLSPAPLYHSAPIGFTIGTQSLGGTVVVMERFDPVEALRLIERHRVTHSQWVPTMFVRFLKLPEETRSRFDLSSHQVAVHAAAPCPVPVKEQIIDWWGPILLEYYGGTELNGLTFITSEQWLAHKGSVGRPVLGIIHICDEDGTEVPVGEPGLVYFELPELPFQYFKDPEKTKDSTHPEHPNWSALGDVGYVDDEGFLYLTDRATFMIISGGVNIYPQEIENLIITHPKVMDVAVIGVAHAEFGEEVKAVVQPIEGVEGASDLARELDAFCREHLAHYKCPRSFDFEAELPRLPTGKLYKRILKDRYWGEATSRIV